MTRAVIIGASAGGIDPLIHLAEGLPADLPAPVLVVVHIPAEAESRLPEIISRRCPLPAAHAVDGEPLHDGRIYIAPPDHHLLIDRGAARVVRGPRQNRHRPAIDPLLRAAAEWAGPGATAVILSGAAGDAVAGCVLVADRGGRVLVQDPAEALFPGMPATVREAVASATILRTVEMPQAITAAVEAAALTRRTLRPMTDSAGYEGAAMDAFGSAPVADPGLPAYSCPDCGGVLEEVDEEGTLRFRCRVGHAFYGDELAAAQWTELEDALWAAVRGMEETAELAGRLAHRADARGASATARRHRRRADDVAVQAHVIRDFLLSPATAPGREERDGPPPPSEMAAAGE